MSRLVAAAAVRAAEQEVPVPLHGTAGAAAQCSASREGSGAAGSAAQRCGERLREGDGAVWGRGAQGELSALCHPERRLEGRRGRSLSAGNGDGTGGDGLRVPWGGSGWSLGRSCAAKSGQHCTAAQGGGEPPSLGVFSDHGDVALGDVGSGMGWGWIEHLRALFQPE